MTASPSLQGTAVNDTSSVTATASAWDSLYQTNTLESATIVKLTRTLAIIPITLFLSYWQSREQKNKQGLQLKKIFPLFILYFILASLLTTLLTSLGVSSSFFTPLKQLSKFLIIMAMSAIGLKTKSGRYGQIQRKIHCSRSHLLDSHHSHQSWYADLIGIF